MGLTSPGAQCQPNGNPKICMEPQETPNSQSNFEKEQNWRYHNPRFQDILQSYSNQNSMVLAQK